MPGPGITRPDLCSKRAAARQPEFADTARCPLSADSYPPAGDDPLAPMPHYAARTLIEASALRTFGYPDRPAGAPRDQPPQSADGGGAMTALPTSFGGSRATAASSIDHAIRLSTAAAVLAVAGIAAYVSYGHAYAVVRAHGGSGITARLEPATIDGLVYASSHGGAVRGTAPGAGPLPGPLAARAGHRRDPHGEHGPGLVPRPGRGGGRGLAGGQSGREGCRLRHLRVVLPCEVWVLGGHPLAGCTLMASWFKHIGGVLVLGVELPDGSTATVPAASTDVFGTVVVQEQVLVLDAEGLRGLRALTTRVLESAQDRSAEAGQ